MESYHLATPPFTGSSSLPRFVIRYTLGRFTVVVSKTAKRVLYALGSNLTFHGLPQPLARNARPAISGYFAQDR
jgi:hypothetical protein